MQQLKEKEYCIQTIKGSRFLAFSGPVSSKEEVGVFLDTIKEKHSKANHYCFAWRFSSGEERMSDDGEPRGSAGLPIFRRLVSMNSVDSMVVVVRYFGGVKLGIGGLIRAYGGITQELLEQASFVPYQEWVSISFVYAYSDSNLVSQLLAHVVHRIVKQEFGEEVDLEILLHKESYESFQSRLFSESSGRITSS
jgi:uncharacterized YigZ family protein